jgi:proteasome accessory factor B
MQHIDRELRDNRFPNCSLIGGIFGRSRKCIQRDIDFMRDQLGAPIDYDRKRKGYFYTKHWAFDPSAFLDRNEAQALAATGKVLSQYQGTPYYDEVCRAIEKLMHRLPVSPAVDSFFEIYSFENPSSDRFDQAAFTLLEQAIRTRTKIKLTYRSPSSQSSTERTVQPYRLHYDQSTGTWYLIAHCEFRKETRTFVVSRIQDLNPTCEPFTIPDGFSISNYMETAFQQSVGPHLYDIAIHFTPYQSQWIREHHWHSSQRVEEHDDGSLILKLSVSSLDAVKRWVMRYGAQAEVLDPKELRDMVRQEVQEMVGVYGAGKI